MQFAIHINIILITDTLSLQTHLKCGVLNTEHVEGLGFHSVYIFLASESILYKVFRTDYNIVVVSEFLLIVYAICAWSN